MEAKHIFCAGCKHVYFFCRAGHFNSLKELFGISLMWMLQELQLLVPPWLCYSALEFAVCDGHNTV